MLSRFTHVRLFVTPQTAAHQAPLSMRFSRQEYWNGLPCPPPGDLPDPRMEPTSLRSPALAGEFFTTSTTWEALQGSGSQSVVPRLVALAHEELVLSHSVVSNSLRHHRLQPTRLLCPWGFSCKSNGVGCHALLQGIFPTQGLNLHLQPCRWILY